MIIVCPHCSKRYRLDDNLIPESGSQVRCSACQTTWHHRSLADQPPLHAKTPDDAHLSPDVKEKNPKKPKRYRSFFLFIFILFILGTTIFGREYIVRIFPESERYYEIAGLPTDSHTYALKITTTTSAIEPTNDKDTIQVEGKVLNASDRVRSIPALKIKVMDDTSHVLDLWEHRLSEQSLLPGEQIYFQTEPHKKIQGAHRIAVEF